MRGFGHCSRDTTTGRCKFHAQLLHNSPKLSSSTRPKRLFCSLLNGLISWIQPPTEAGVGTSLTHAKHHIRHYRSCTLCVTSFLTSGCCWLLGKTGFLAVWGFGAGLGYMDGSQGFGSSRVKRFGLLKIQRQAHQHSGGYASSK